MRRPIDEIKRVDRGDPPPKRKRSKKRVIHCYENIEAFKKNASPIWFNR